MPFEEQTPGDQPKNAPAEGEVSSGKAAGGRILHRAMREDPAGGPMVGPTARTHGVRSNVDIPVTAGLVHPNTGGLSVALDRPENLHSLRRPPRFGGTGKDPAWYIGADQLAGELQLRQDSPIHGLIEPARAMSLDDFQTALENTKPDWGRLT